jgi:thiamine biosynthesis lipoprotein
MATEVTVLTYSTDETSQLIQDALDQVEALFYEAEKRCSRFIPTSDLSTLNAEPNQMRQLTPILYAMIDEARRAHELTSGTFDPRVLNDLVHLGYDRTFSAIDVQGRSSLTQKPSEIVARSQLPPWRPKLDPITMTATVGEHALDLGGVGKGLTVRMSAELLRAVTPSFLIEAGGDCYLGGTPPESTVWSVGVENPLAQEDHLAVLGLRDVGCATSSKRIRRWIREGVPVHHLIDPHTGLPGGDGLLSVTVVDPDPALAEVWSKALFLSGEHMIENQASLHNLAALWVFESGIYQYSENMEEKITWLSV